MAMVLTDFEREGFVLVPGLLDNDTVTYLRDVLDSYTKRVEGASQRAGSVYGLRNLLRELPEVREVARDPAVREIIRQILGAEPFAVRALFFDKTPAANWPVPYHQDRTIVVAEKNEGEGFGPWSLKNGIVHVQPPVTILERIVALRLHLDPCGEDNGPLYVLPGTHRLGKLDTERITALRNERAEVACIAKCGDGLLMRPLLLHRSGETTGNIGHRRVLHIEWAADILPDGLKWYDSI